MRGSCAARISISAGVHDVKAVWVGPGVARLKAEVHFDAHALAARYLDAGENAAHVWADMRAAEDEAAARAVAGKFARALIIALALETDALERDVRAAHPEFRYIDLEVM